MLGGGRKLNGKDYVSSTIKRLRKRLKENPDKTSAFKESVLDTVTFGTEDFERRMRLGEIKINTVADYEKLVKLGLLILGEATEKVEHTTDVEEITTTQFNAIKEMKEFEAIKEKLALEMNKQNENTK
jgi:hypothetical protein